MHIVINDKPVDQLTAKVEKALLLAKLQEKAEGAVMTAADATDYYVSQTRRWFIILSVVALVLMVGIIVAGISYEPGSTPTFILFALIIAGSFLFFMWWLLRRKSRVWNEKLVHRSEGLPPAGTAVAFDADGVTVGAESFAWPSLAIDQLELTLSGTYSGETSQTVCIVERLGLRSGSRTFVLDRQMMQNGPRLVDNVWRKLRPKPA